MSEITCNTCLAELPAGSKSCSNCWSDDLTFTRTAHEPSTRITLPSLQRKSNSRPRGAVAGRGYRFLGLLLDGVLVAATLGIGWLVWFCFIASRGQTPAKFLMKMQVVGRLTGQPTFAATFWRYFIPNILSWLSLPFTVLGLFSLPFALAWLLGVVQFLATVLPLVDALMIFGKRRQRLVDKFFDTEVRRY